MNTYTLQEACIALGIDSTTLWRWLADANMEATKDATDKRKRYLTETQVQALAKLHNRQVQGISLADSRQVQDVSLATRLQSAMQSIEILTEQVKDLQVKDQGLRAEVEALKAQIARPPTIPVEQKAPRQRQERTEKAEEATLPGEALPDGLVILGKYAEDHNVPETTVGRSIKDKRLPVAPGGPWKVGRVYVKNALNEAGRERFHELYLSRDDFTAPDDCDICQRYALPPELVDARAFADLHHISLNKVRELIGKGMIQVVKGTWKVGDRFIDRALDMKGQRDFWIQCHKMEGFTSCDHCPHSTT